MMTDPIADMLTRMRNALRNHFEGVSFPGSALKVSVLEVFKREGYITSYEVHGDGPRSVVNVALKYGADGQQVITKLSRYSKPGCRRYRGVTELPKVRGGLGISVVSTNRGVLSDRECREHKIGGEVLCTIE
ncbi:MAG: 30S ribosomal protein S8 [Planctomycetota bacterium]